MNEVAASKEGQRWQETTLFFGEQKPILTGPYLTYILRKSPRRLLHMLSYYKFAAKVIGANQDVLEVGCSEGLGSLLMAEFSNSYLGLDIEGAAVERAIKNFQSEKCSFQECDFLKFESPTLYGGIVSLDVIEHIYPENEDVFVEAIYKKTKRGGCAVIGTPNITSDQYASAVTRSGHVNLFSGERLQNLMGKYYDKTLLFSANDEIVHTGFSPMAHYLICIGIRCG